MRPCRANPLLPNSYASFLLAKDGPQCRFWHFKWCGTVVARICAGSMQIFCTMRFRRRIRLSRSFISRQLRLRRWWSSRYECQFGSAHPAFLKHVGEGGIYLDTDMELLKSLDCLLSDAAFVGDTKSGDTSCGIIGAAAHHPFVLETLNFYDSDNEFSTTHTSPRVIQKVLREHPFSGVMVYGPEFFYPCDDGEPCSLAMLEHAYATHHWAESWVPFAKTRKFARRIGVMPLLKKLFSK